MRNGLRCFIQGSCCLSPKQAHWLDSIGHCALVNWLQPAGSRTTGRDKLVMSSPLQRQEQMVLALLATLELAILVVEILRCLRSHRRSNRRCTCEKPSRERRPLSLWNAFAAWYSPDCFSVSYRWMRCFFSPLELHLSCFHPWKVYRGRGRSRRRAP